MRRTAALLLAAAALLLGGCAAMLPPQTEALTRVGAQDLPLRAELVDVPFFPQTPYHCGPAALATVLGHLGLDAAPETLAQALFLPARQGTLQTEMLAGARRWGAVAYRLPRELHAVLSEVAAGRPVLVLQNLGLALAPLWHYAVVVGFDLNTGHVVLRSGVTKRELLSLATFEYTWARAGHWAIVALAPGQLPSTVDEAAAIEAALGFERVALPQAAAKTYSAIWQRWPDSLTAGMGLGNARMAAGEVDSAAQAYVRVAKAHANAAAWNNAAQAHLRQGQLDAAELAAQRAVDLSRGAQSTWLTAAIATRDAVGQARRAASR